MLTGNKVWTRDISSDLYTWKLLCCFLNFVCLMQAAASLRPVCHLYPYSTVALPVIGVLTEKSFCTYLLMESGCWRDSGLDIVLFVEAKMLKTEENK